MPMRIIPVLDLQGGQAVHAIAGDRAHYRPIQSVLHEGPDPIGLARAYRDSLGLRDLYLADLDAIAGAPLPSPCTGRCTRWACPSGPTPACSMRPRSPRSSTRASLGSSPAWRPCEAPRH